MSEHLWVSKYCFPREPKKLQIGVLRNNNSKQIDTVMLFGRTRVYLPETTYRLVQPFLQSI